MLSVKTQCNLGNAEKYFQEHLQHGDYYSQDNRVLGQWVGADAQRLGLSGTVRQDDFLMLCHNENPKTGGLLTQRLKTTRQEIGNDGQAHRVANRRIFYDFTFSPPKSVSIQALVANDERILVSHDRAVRVAVGELERFAGTRFHKGKRTFERHTGSVVCALFRHDTSRALDPHLHTHCIMFNATRDPVEYRWKALSNYEMLQARKFAENVYYHELARDLQTFGYGIQSNPRGDFQIEGVPTELCDLFSKRHGQIDAKIQKLLNEKPELAGSNLKDLREWIAQTERERKVTGIKPEALRQLWDGQLAPGEKRRLLELTKTPAPQVQRENAHSAVNALQWAEDHLFDRRSVVHEHELWSAALEHARGSGLTLEHVKAASQKRDYLRSDGRSGKVTTREVLGREWEIVCLAHDGRGKHAAFNPNCHISPQLKADQRQAAEKILQSRDFVTLFSGGAGTGKSHTLREIGKGLNAAGFRIQVVAPQRQQALDLRKSFEQTQTVTEFLTKRAMIRGGVVLVDEAGQIGGRQMHDLLKFVKENDGRVILSGDTRQHGAVEATDALRAIEKYAGLQPARLLQIRRQNPNLAESEDERKRIKEYREAVAEAQRGQHAQSFDRLNRLGVIAQCWSATEQRERLASEYLALTASGRSTVVVSQTWAEIHQVNERIRDGLRESGVIGEQDFTVTAYEKVDLTNAQKRDLRFYEPESVLKFNRKVGGFSKGDSAKLLKITPTHLVIESAERVGRIAFQQLDRFSVCRPKQLPLAEGDRLQLKANGKSDDGKELVNGELVTVQRGDERGCIRLSDGRTLPTNYREFVRGYAVTSYGSQGKTVEHVLFSDSAVKAATNNQQWLVTISRGTRGVKIFTQDKEQLRENVSRLGDRELAIELGDGPLAPANVSEKRSEGIHSAILRYVERFIAGRRQPPIESKIGGRSWRNQSIHQGNQTRAISRAI